MYILKEYLNYIAMAFAIFTIWLIVSSTGHFLTKCNVVYCECHDHQHLPYPNDVWISRAYKTFLSNFLIR